MATKKGMFDLNNVTLESLRFLYANFFSLGNNTTQSFEHKIELLTLVSGLTQQMQKHFPGDWTSSFDVLKDYIYKDIQLSYGEDQLLKGLSILCDDLLYGVNPIALPYTKASETKDRIKDLIAEWLPF